LSPRRLPALLLLLALAVAPSCASTGYLRGFASLEAGIAADRAALADHVGAVLGDAQAIRAEVARIEMEHGDGVGVGALVAAILAALGVGGAGVALGRRPGVPSPRKPS